MPEFPAQFQIPLAALKNWEQGAGPQSPAAAYLPVIEGEPAVGP
jgi:DNA-binding transcriptional regulator YiaG